MDGCKSPGRSFIISDAFKVLEETLMTSYLINPQQKEETALNQQTRY